MRRLLAAAALAAALGGSGVALADGANVRVSPRHGGPHRAFVVGFTAPAPSGDQGVMSRSYTVSAARRRGSGCTWSVSVAAPAAQANERVHTYLKPDAAWCRGRFKGAVTMLEGPNCNAGPPCPARAAIGFPSRIETLGRFSFRVR